MSDLSFSKNTKPGLGSSITNISSGRRRKNTGCLSCLSGCLVMLLIICGIFAGIFAYIYYMDKDEALGAIVVKLLKNQSININLMTDINNNQNIPVEEKIAIKISYDKFLSDYDTMPEDKQIKIKKNFGVLIKKFFNDPTFLATGPPPKELKDLMRILVPNQQLFPKNDDKPEYEEIVWLKLKQLEALQKDENKKPRRRIRRSRP